MSNIKDLIRQEIERLYDGEAPKHDQQCEFEDGYFTGIATISKFIDSLPEEKPSEDLEKAARLYAIPHYMRDVDVNYLEEYPYDKIAEAAFIAGAKWALNQGVKATGIISPRGIIYDNNIGYRLFLERYHNGDKVEVQVRKIEENGK